jgi:hypothetical protein
MVRSLSDKLSSLCNELTEVKAQLKKTEEMEVKNKRADLSEVASESSREFLDRERRKSNLVWFGIPESTASDARNLVMDDTAFVVECCSKVLNTPIDVTSCRPLLVTVKDPAQVWSVLTTAGKLGKSADYVSVFVKKSSTPFRECGFSQEVARENQAERHGKSGQSLPSCQDNTGRLRSVRGEGGQVISRNDVRRSRRVNNVGSNRINQSENVQRVLKCFTRTRIPF